METYIPLISTRTKGPLGLVHLPRLWLKMRFRAKAKLAEGYRAGEGGFDGILLTALGIESTFAVAFIISSQPSYLAFEVWVKENAKPESLTPEAIEEFNKRILSFPKPEPGRAETLELLGLPQSDKEWMGTDLNDLDDWHGVHLALLDEE
jgi:hypothetical protein